MSCQSLLQVGSGQVGWDTCIDFGLADLLAAAQIRQEEPRRYGHVCAVLREMTASDSVGHQACGEEVRSPHLSFGGEPRGRPRLSEREDEERVGAGGALVHGRGCAALLLVSLVQQRQHLLQTQHLSLGGSLARCGTDKRETVSE